MVTRQEVWPKYIPAKVPANLIKVKTEGAKLVTPLAAAVEELEITSPEELQGADEILSGITSARKQWAAKMEPILSPLRSAKTAADALKREIDQPLERLEAQVKSKMRDYRLQEAQENERIRLANEKAQAKVTAKIEATAKQELNAKSDSLRDRLAAARLGLEAQAQELADEAPQATQTAHSTTRKVLKWRLSRLDDEGMLAILRGILASQIPLWVVLPDAIAINKALSSKHITYENITQWPGFEVYEDLVVVNR